MTVRKLIIKTCDDCPNMDYSGTYTPGGPIPLCTKIGWKGEHVSTYPDKWFSVLPFEATIGSDGMPYREGTGEIPDWCPLEKESE